MAQGREWGMSVEVIVTGVVVLEGKGVVVLVSVWVMGSAGKGMEDGLGEG